VQFLWDDPIIRSETAYRARARVCVIVFDLETSTVMHPRPEIGC
jgi:hypothetical protein